MIKKLAFTGVGIVLLASPLVVSPVLAFAATPTSCPVLARTLARGAKGSDVTVLQQFLVARSLLTSDSATGYFGGLTQVAVQKFQASQGLVSSGTPASTGYGSVGKMTRAAIGLACTHVNSSTNTPANTSPSPAPKSAPPSSLQPKCPLVALPIGQACTGKWKEVKDTQGCTASWQCATQ